MWLYIPITLSVDTLSRNKYHGGLFYFMFFVIRFSIACLKQHVFLFTFISFPHSIQVYVNGVKLSWLSCMYSNGKIDTNPNNLNDMIYMADFI